MRRSFLQLTAAAAIVLGIALAGSNFANAQSVMKVCGDQWKAGKAAGTTNGETWPQFLAQCRAQQNSGAATPPTAAPTPAAPSSTYGQAPATAAVKTVSQCDAEYAANKAAIRAAGQTKRALVAVAGPATRQSLSELRRLPRPLQRQRQAPASAPAARSNSSAGVPAEPPYSSLPRPIASASSPQTNRALIARPILWSGSIRSPGLSFRWDPQLRAHERGRLHVRSRRAAAGDRAAMNERHP